MKKYSLLFLVSFFVWDLQAQITITTADIATPGKIIYRANDTLPTITVGAAGTSQTWNFLGSLNANTIDTLTFMPLIDAANYIDFPATNVIFPLNLNGDLSYADNNSADLSILAVSDNRILFPGGSRETIVTTNTPPEKVLQFPETYNSSFTAFHKSFTQYFYGSVPPSFHPSTDNSKSFDPSQSFAGSVARECGMSDSLREKRSFDKTVLADAWGSLTTAAGTFDVLRIKETKISHDTIEAHDALLFAWFYYKLYSDSITTYYWYANGIGVPLVTATMDSTGNVSNIKWLTAMPTALGINEITNVSNVLVYPNPAQNNIGFHFQSSDKIISIEVFDITGRMIRSYPVSGDQTTLNIPEYPNGMYTYALVGKGKSVVERGKFSVAK